MTTSTETAEKTSNPKSSFLVIVESPAKAKTIEKYLGPGYKVTSSIGHVRDLPKSNKDAVDIDGGFIPRYIVSPGKEKVIKELQQLYTVNCSWAAAETSTLPLFVNRSSNGKTKYYLCRNNQCGIPLESIDEVQMKLQAALKS